MDRPVVEITINDTGNIEFSVHNNEIKRLNESQFAKVIKTLTQLKTTVSMARELTKAE